MTGLPRDPVNRSPLPRRVAVRAWRIAAFTLSFAWEFVVSNATVLREILTPGTRVSPAIVALPLRCRTAVEIVSLANLITLTPGTLTLEVVQEPPTLYVHGMFARDPGAFLRQLSDLEGRMLAAMRPVDEPLASPPAGPGTGR
jgi:multicomponent Na+:H+ antiporter subunit E